MSGDVSSLAVQLQGLRDSHASLISLLNSLIAKFRGYLTSGNTDSIAEVQGLLHAAEQRLGHAEACTSQVSLCPLHFCILLLF
jgi:CHASE3 domain sensor protein